MKWHSSVCKTLEKRLLRQRNIGEDYGNIIKAYEIKDMLIE